MNAKHILLNKYFSSLKDTQPQRIKSRADELSYGDNNITMDNLPLGIDDDMNLEGTDPDLQLELTQLQLKKLKLQEQQIEMKEKMLLQKAHQEDRKKSTSGSTRCVMLKVPAEGLPVPSRDTRDPETSFIAGAGDSNHRERDGDRTCKSRTWDKPGTSDGDDGSSTPSTCKLCPCNNRNQDNQFRYKKEPPSKKDRYYKSPDYNKYEEKDKEYRHKEKRSEYSRRDNRCHYEDRCHEKEGRWQEKNKETGHVKSYRGENKKNHERSQYKYEVDKRGRYERDLNNKESVTSKMTDLTSKQSYNSKFTDFMSKRSAVTSKKLELTYRKIKKHKSEDTCELKYNDFYSDNEDEADETNRLIQLRNSDYMDVVDDNLKIVVALDGYPKSKIRLQQLECFQQCLSDIIDMQMKSSLVINVPTFTDYYLNRGAIVCICKDMHTRDWMVRISPGLQERMSINLILLKAKVKRLCLAILKIPRCCWPASAPDAFKLLQYFNPTLKTESWKIYSQRVIDNVECTSFVIDRVSGEIIRGPTFKNVIDYNQMVFELIGYTEIYYECLLSDPEEDLSSLASRVKLLEEIKSEEPTPRNKSTFSLPRSKRIIIEQQSNIPESIEPIEENYETDDNKEGITDVKSQLDCTLQRDVLNKLKGVWSDETAYSDQEAKGDVMRETEYFSREHKNVISTSGVAVSEKTESIYESNDNLTLRHSNLNIDSNRGIAYHRRTNYLHVENELKVAITLEGYPQSKLEGTHIRRLKHLFKEYLHKDMKNQRFTNLIIPKFQDIYLSNGAVIYICDSLETKDYLTEVLPKFINSTGLKLTFRDIKDLVRYTRIVMRLPKEHAHVESVEILLKLQVKYPKLRPDCWKYYSDVAGKQKRQFGVDPESLEVIKSPDFDPTYEGDKISFRIIDRQKRDLSFEEPATTDKDPDAIDNAEARKIRENVLKNMYVAIDPEIINTPLTRIRTNHYSDLIPDNQKLYIGPSNYPETRIDDSLFHSIKRTLENIVREAIEHGEMNEESMPKIHDMYLFDGVIFIICQNMPSRHWIEQILVTINAKLHISLKSTEFRGAVGIINMVVKTDKSTDEIINILQTQNPRLRTKYWRKISTVRTKTKMDVVLQIDKLSAQVMTSENFNKFIGPNPVQFKLGHLQSLLKPKASLEELTKIHTKKQTKKQTSNTKLPDSKSKVSMQGPRDITFEELKTELKNKYPSLRVDNWDVIEERNKGKHKVSQLEIDDESAKIIQKEDYKLSTGDEKLYFYAGLSSVQSDADPGIEIDSPRSIDDNIVLQEMRQTPRTVEIPVQLENSEQTLQESRVLLAERSNQTLRKTSSVLPEKFTPVLQKSSLLLSGQSTPALPRRSDIIPIKDTQGVRKMILKIPQNILPDNKEDLSIIFDLLEDKNPGLTTASWQMYTESPFPNNGKITILADKQSASIIQSKNFDSTIGEIGGEDEWLIKIPGLQRVPSTQCVKCGVRALLFCARCGVTPYCSEHCQYQDWHERHRGVCHNLVGPLKVLDVADGGSRASVAPPSVRQRSPPPTRHRSPPPPNNQYSSEERPRFDASRGGNSGRGRNFNPRNGEVREMRRPMAVDPPRGGYNNSRGRGRGRYQNQNGMRNNMSYTQSDGHQNVDQDEEDWESAKPQELTRKESVQSRLEQKPEPAIVQETQPAPKPVAVQEKPAPAPTTSTVKLAPPVEETPKVAAPAAMPKFTVSDATPKKKIIPKNYLIETLPIGSTVVLSVDAHTSDCRVAGPGFVCLSLHNSSNSAYEAVVSDFTEACQQDTVTFIPSPGDAFSYYSSDEEAYYRARCLSATSAALIDGMRVVALTPCEKTRRLPLAYQGQPEFSCVLQADQAKLQMTLEATLLAKTPSGFRVSLKEFDSKADLGHGEVSRWVPTVEYSTPAPVPAPAKAVPTADPQQSTLVPPEVPRPDVKHNRKVYLVNATALDRVFVRPSDMNSQRAYDSVLQATAQYGLRAIPLTEAPVVGTVVVSKYSDGNYYRALVKRTKKDANRYQLEYLETGIIEVTQLENLYLCPPELGVSACGVMTSRVTIARADVPTQLTPAAERYIEPLKENAEMLMTLSTGEQVAPSGIQVTLTVMKTNTNLNAKLNDLCTPDWKKIEERGGDVIETPPLMYNSLKFMELPRSGCELTITDTSELFNSTVVSGFLKDDHHVRYVMTTLSEKMADYCRSPIGREPYLPNDAELCIAKTKDNRWVRAVKIEQDAPGSPTVSVLYVDYGNLDKLPATNLRKMLPEFVSDIPAAGVMLYINDFPEAPTASQLAAALTYMRFENGCGSLTVTQCDPIPDEDGNYNVSAPGLIQAVRSA